MNNTQPFSDLEMHEVLSLIYPEHIKSDDEFDLSAEACHAHVDLGCGLSVRLDDLLGRIVRLTVPQYFGITGNPFHCLCEVSVSKGELQIRAVVKREFTTGNKNEKFCGYVG